jgi:hypothetical protein
VRHVEIGLPHLSYGTSIAALIDRIGTDFQAPCGSQTLPTDLGLPI